MKYNTACKFFLLLVCRRKKLIMLSRVNLLPLEKNGSVPGSEMAQSEYWRQGKVEEQRAVILKSGFEVLGSNTVFFHEIIQISPVFSG